VSRHLLAQSPKDIGIPSIVIFELEIGIARSTSPQKRKLQLKEMISVVHVFPFGHLEATIAASIRIDLERQGLLIGPYDILIAATTVAHKGILVTHNTKEFKRIKGLSLEDWY
jgi:tRNA(fMet)-specific endonuclease VapC